MLILNEFISGRTEGELWVGEDGELGAADAVQRCAEHQLTVVVRDTPPGGHLGGAGGQQQTLFQRGVRKDSLTEAAEEANAIECAGRSLLCDGGHSLGKW